MMLYMVGAKLDFWAALQVTFVDTGAGSILLLTLLLTNDKTFSKSPKTMHCHLFLAIVNSIHSLSVVYVCVQALSGQISGVSTRGLRQHQKKCEAFLKHGDDTN